MIFGIIEDYAALSLEAVRRESQAAQEAAPIETSGDDASRSRTPEIREH